MPVKEFTITVPTKQSDVPKPTVHILKEKPLIGPNGELIEPKNMTFCKWLKIFCMMKVLLFL
jgi:hypothetical protein